MMATNSNNQQHAEAAIEGSGRRLCKAPVATVAMADVAVTGQRKWRETGDAWKQWVRKMDGRADH
jgi:hypothetical protein